MEYVQEDGSNQNLGEEEKDNKSVFEYFRFIYFQNPVHKTFGRVGWSVANYRQLNFLANCRIMVLVIPQGLELPMTNVHSIR